MKKVLLVLSIISLTLFACKDYGKKVTIGEKSEVYYKGTDEAEAKKLGDYLMQHEYFDNKSHKTVQLVKEDDQYIVRFEVEEKIINQNKEMFIQNFEVFQEMISQRVFGG